MAANPEHTMSLDQITCYRNSCFNPTKGCGCRVDNNELDTARQSFYIYNKLNFLIDTGAGISVIPRNTFIARSKHHIISSQRYTDFSFLKKSVKCGFRTEMWVSI